MAIASDLALPSHGVIIDYYNRRNNRVLKIDAVKVNPAEDAKGMPAGDTTTTLVGLRPTDINGITRVYYNRLSLDKYLGGDIIRIPNNKYKNISDILKEVFNASGINISAKEVFPIKIPKSFNTGATPLTLEINKGVSALYAGTFNIKISFDPLVTRVRNVMLNGFEIPPEDL